MKAKHFVVCGAGPLKNKPQVCVVRARKVGATLSTAAVGIDHQKERLEPGKDADIVICDHELNARKVKAGRRLVYETQN